MTRRTSAAKAIPKPYIKKKKGKDQEVQEGWLGHIIPFELVQQTYLKDENHEIKQKENRLSEIVSEYEEILDTLSEEEKESEAINDAKDGFVKAGVIKEIKQIKADIKEGDNYPEDSYETQILKVGELLSEEKELKAQVKSETAKLHLQTKETIEKLSDEQVIELLELKWVSPLIISLNQLPEAVINELTSKLQTLSEKYAATYEEVVNQIHKTESTISSLVDDLVGNEYDMKGLSEFKSLLKGE